MTKTKNEAEPTLDFFFWLGADGEAIPVTEQEFNKKILEDRERQRKYLEVDVSTD